MDIGEVRLEARTVGGQIREVRVHSRRPRLAPMLRGRSIAELTRVVPLVYAVCARAQSAALAAALVAARGEPPRTVIDPPVALEAAREQLLAVLTGSAQPLLGLARDALGDCRVLRTFLAETLLGRSVEAWRSMESLAELESWMRGVQTPLARECLLRHQSSEPRASPVPMLPTPHAAQSLAEWPALTVQLVELPSWRDGPAETGAVARLGRHPLVQALADRPLLQHWVARLLELLEYAAEVPEALCGRVSGAVAGPGRGRSAVETARGTLLQEVTLDGERVLDYAILAPTEWNFHPQGPIAHWLAGTPSRSSPATLELARRAVAALDPCVECRYAID